MVYVNDLHFVIDIETLGVTVKAPILQIGVVVYFKGNIETVYNSGVISLASNFNVNQSCIDKDTVLWLDKNNKELLLGCLTSKKSLDEEIYYLHRGIGRYKDRYPVPSYYWAKSPSFDLAILSNAYKNVDFSEDPHWNYKTERDIRTIEPVVSCNYKNECPHDALSDATYEAKVLGEFIKTCS